MCAADQSISYSLALQSLAYEHKEMVPDMSKRPRATLAESLVRAR